MRNLKTTKNMKTKIITLILMLGISLTFAQDYNKDFIEVEGGLTKLKDFTYIAPYNLDLGYRHMFNTKIGYKINANYIDHKGYEFYSAGFHMVMNMGRVLNFESFTKSYTVLAGVGGAYTYSDSPLLYKPLSNAHFSAFADNVIKVNDRISIKAGIELMGHINSRHFVENHVLTTTTSILNYNVGINIALGRHKESADFYIEQPRIEKIYLKPITIDKTVTNNITSSECNCKSEEYVFFKHDSYEVEKDGLNGVLKMAEKLKEGENIYLTGYASPPSTEEYNKTLSGKRCEAVKSKLISLGISEDRIVIEEIGEIDTEDSNNVDLSRRVKIQIK